MGQAPVELAIALIASIDGKATAGLTSVLTFHSFHCVKRRVFMQSRAFSIFELIDIKRDSIYIGLNFPEKYR